MRDDKEPDRDLDFRRHRSVVLQHPFSNCEGARAEGVKLDVLRLRSCAQAGPQEKRYQRSRSFPGHASLPGSWLHRRKEHSERMPRSNERSKTLSSPDVRSTGRSLPLFWRARMLRSGASQCELSASGQAALIVAFRLFPCLCWPKPMLLDRAAE